MFVYPRFSSSNGQILAGPPDPVRFPDDPIAAEALAGRMDRMADEAAAECNFALADKLTLAAITARSKAAGARA
jgi:hypothetical protein